MGLGEKIKQARLEAGLSQRQLGGIEILSCGQSLPGLTQGVSGLGKCCGIIGPILQKVGNGFPQPLGQNPERLHGGIGGSVFNEGEHIACDLLTAQLPLGKLRFQPRFPNLFAQFHWITPGKHDLPDFSILENKNPLS